MNTEMIADEIRKRRRSGSVLLVGIDGLGGAGKSTVVEERKSALEADYIKTAVFHIDDCIHPRDVRYNDEYP
ncbi:MAG: uridine kinase, partial [Ruminococcus sp.]|nr:uridine kinase [Ruminococcus sp.]